MKNVTLQLFEYLLAAQNSNLSVNYNLNKYPAYWFLDEILSFANVKLEHVIGDRVLIRLEKPKIADQKIKKSASLTAILSLLNQENIDEEQVVISKNDLEKTLFLEADALKRKLDDEEKETVIVNDWQQILLEVDKSRIPTDVAKKQEKNLKKIIERLLREFQTWQIEVKQKSVAHTQMLKSCEFYEYLINLYGKGDSNKKMSLGVGILHISGEPSIYHSLLTIGIELFVDPSKNVCELIFEKPFLKIDEVLDRVLFNNLETAQQIRKEIDELKIDPFDEKTTANVLNKIVKFIHPEGQYFSSPIDAVLAKEEVVQILHRSVIFIKEKQPFTGEAKLRPIVEHLTLHNMPSDVIGSIADPDFLPLGKYSTKIDEQNLIDESYLWPENAAEKEILDHLNDHHAVAVLEKDKKSKITATANLITYLATTEKRILVVGENEEELTSVRKKLPQFLDEISCDIPSKRNHYKKLKENLTTLQQKKENYTLSQTEVDKILIELKEATHQYNETIKKLVDYRQLSSKKIIWQEQEYQPYELAQLVSKLGGKEQLASDLIPLDLNFEMEEAEILKLWELKSYFTPENMDLLNYDFINLNELNDYQEYQKLLILEKECLELSIAAGDYLTSMFDEKTDIRFVQYLYDQLPKLMEDVAKIKSPYGNEILKKAIANQNAHDNLTSALVEANEKIKQIKQDEISTDEKKIRIQELNDLLEISSSELLTLEIQDQEGLLAFYDERKFEMMETLDIANLILIFNEGAIALSSAFKGITDDGIDMMDVLYNAAALHLSEVEFEIYWLRVKSHFIRLYQPTLHKEHIHPLCTDIYEALKNDQIDTFKEKLEQLTDLVLKRQNFIKFGNFIEKISLDMPIFTANIMSEDSSDIPGTPNLKETFDQGKLHYLIDQLQPQKLKALEQGLNQANEKMVKLQQEVLEIANWKNLQSLDEKKLLETKELLDAETPNSEAVNSNLLQLFQIIFTPLSESNKINNFDPELFDLVIFIDASKSNILRMSEFMHAHKAILFGNDQEKPLIPLKLRTEDSQKLIDKFGHTLQQFGEEYFEDSLFNLVINSAAWDSQVELPATVAHMLASDIKNKVQTEKNKCENQTQEEILECLTKMGYDVLTKIQIEQLTFDFFVIGDKDALAINVLGNKEMEKAFEQDQIEKEIILDHKGVNIHTIHAAQFYLNSRQTLVSLYKRLEQLKIYPSKNKGSD